MIRLFFESDLQKGKTIKITDSRIHYIRDVMRRNVGDELLFFNGINGEWKGRISSISKKAVCIEINEQTAKQGTPAKVNLYFSILKKDKTDLIVEKATELNVSSVNPIITERTITSQTNLNRFKLISIEAAEQCERTHLPKIAPPVKFAELLNHISSVPEEVFFIMDERGKGETPANAFLQHKGKEVSFIIGPEGGFSEKEFENITQYKNVVNVSMGKNILRAETAVIAAISSWHALCGDFS